MGESAEEDDDAITQAPPEYTTKPIGWDEMIFDLSSEAMIKRDTQARLKRPMFSELRKADVFDRAATILAKLRDELATGQRKR